MTAAGPGDRLRANAAAEVRAALRGKLDIDRLARSAEELPTPAAPLPAPAWTAVAAVDIETLDAVRAIVEEVTNGSDPQLVLRRKDGEQAVYLRRWWLDRETDAEGRGQRGLYVHEFRGSDPTRLHDHPWPSASLLVSGRLVEHSGQGTQVIVPGTVCLRPAGFRHRLALVEGRGRPQPAVTLFATGNRAGDWGFEEADGSITDAGRSELRMRRES